MVHPHRRQSARFAALLLCGVIGAGLPLAVGGTLLGTGTSSASAAEHQDDRPTAAEAKLDAYGLPVFTALNRARANANLPALTIDDDLVRSAERDACAMARGELPLSGSTSRLAEAGGERENVGLVVDGDPVSGARTIHEWWNQTSDHRADRMDSAMHRYGIGVCVAEERAYYVERFGS